MKKFVYTVLIVTSFMQLLCNKEEQNIILPKGKSVSLQKHVSKQLQLVTGFEEHPVLTKHEGNIRHALSSCSFTTNEGSKIIELNIYPVLEAIINPLQETYEKTTKELTYELERVELELDHQCELQNVQLANKDIQTDELLDMLDSQLDMNILLANKKLHKQSQWKAKIVTATGLGFSMGVIATLYWNESLSNTLASIIQKLNNS